MRVAANGVRLYVDFDGAKLRRDGPWLREVPTVVHLHTGPGTDHTAYKETIGPAVAQDAQMVYIDLRGHGRSDASTPTRGASRFERMACEPSWSRSGSDGRH